VEVAAYRIVLEALTNVALHAPGASASVRIALADTAGLEIEVSDDAVPGAAWTPGVGIASMRERAAEVGGTLTSGPTPTGGIVRARLPLAGGPSPARTLETASR
jgi:signal transduction histidine kinase